MRKWQRRGALLWGSLTLVGITKCRASKPPHIVVHLADDFGWHAVGWRNPEFFTPHIDALKASGLLLTNHYVYQYCSPTRSSLMSGRLPLHVNQQNGPWGVDLRMTMLPQKLAAAGYVSHLAGKWHCGMMTSGHLPVARGFNTSLGYLSGECDHYTQMEGGHVDLWDTKAPAYGKNGTYGGFQYSARAVEVVEQHAAKNGDASLFLYVPWQNTHSPLFEVPAKWIDPRITWPERQTAGGMTTALDSGISNVTAALNRTGMLDTTLILFSADNGGPSWWNGMACHMNNYPLRGGKFTDFQGGVRVVAFLAGGALPMHLRGQEYAGYIHVADWYFTFQSIAGLAAGDWADKPVGVPPTDSINVWPSVVANTTSPRIEMALSSWSIIVDGWKLITNHHNIPADRTNFGLWTGPIWPNKGDVGMIRDVPCPPVGCLFNLNSDPFEKVDLSAQCPSKVAELMQKLIAANSTYFQPGGSPGSEYLGPYTKCLPQSNRTAMNGNFLSPMCTLH